MNICTKPLEGKRCTEQPTLHIDDYCWPCRIDHSADLAMKAVHAFAKASGLLNQDNQYTDDLHSIVSDLLCDLMHYADREEISMVEAHSSACRNYLEELAELTPRPKGEWGIVLPDGEWARVKNGVFDQTGTELYRSNNYWARKKANNMGTATKIWWAKCPAHGNDDCPSGSCHDCAMLQPPPAKIDNGINQATGECVQGCCDGDTSGTGGRKVGA